jgi:hypothetical protein
MANDLAAQAAQERLGAGDAVNPGIEMVRAAERLGHPGGERALPTARFALDEEVAAIGEVRQEFLEPRSQEPAVDVILGLLPQPGERLDPERFPAVRDGREAGGQATGYTNSLRTPASNSVGGY